MELRRFEVNGKRGNRARSCRMQFLRAPRKLAGQGYEVGPCTGSAQECSRVSLENLRRSAGRGTLAQSVCSFGMLTIIRVTHPASYSLGFRQLYFSITLTCKRGTKPEAVL